MQEQATTFELDSEEGSRAGKKEWLGLALLALPLFVLAIDSSVLFLAAPHISEDLAPSSTEWLWALDIYGFVIAGFLVTMGALGDRIGRRRLLVFGSAVFAAMSLWAAFANNPLTLIAARAALGLAGATLMPSTLALIRNMFHHPQQRTSAIAIWMTTFAVGVAVGPLIGGLLLEFFWWGSVFLLAVPIMMLVILYGPRLLPESLDPDPPQFDLTSAILSVITMITTIFAFKDLVANGVHLTSMMAIVVGGLTGLVFLRRQNHIPNPLVDPRLFQSRVFRSSLAILLTGVFAATTVNFLVPQFLQSVAELSPLRAGLFTAPIPTAAILSSLASPKLAERWSGRLVIAGGSLIALVGFLVLGQSHPDGSIWILVAGGALASIGLSPITVLTTDMVVTSAPESRAGSAAALSETIGELGVALAIAIMGTLLSLMYRLRINLLLPDHIDAGVRTEVSTDITSATSATSRLSPRVSESVSSAAFESFAFAFNGVAYLCAAIALALCALSLYGLHRRVMSPAQA